MGGLAALVAARAPAPGGGAVAAVSAALAAGLVEMAARFGDPDRDTAPAERAASVRAEALALADDDAAAYTAVLEAQRLPAGTEGRATRVAAALSAAADVPLRVAALAAEAAETGARLATTGNPHLRGDALAAVLVAEAAAAASAALVAINLRAAPDDPRHGRARELAARAAAARGRAAGDSGPAAA